LFSFRYTSSVCKHVLQDGTKIELQTLVHALTKYWWILPILSVLCPANELQRRFISNLTTSKTCCYTILKNNCFQKLCQRSTVTSDQTCAYWWREWECKHNLKLKHKLNFSAHPVRQNRLHMFTNTGSISKIKRNLT